MFQDQATLEENCDRFVRRVLATELVWGVRNESRFQSCGSNDDDNANVLLFWSDAAYARRAITNDFQGCENGKY
jgi:hypothetical protein